MAANKGGNTVEKVKNIALPLAAEMGLKVWDVRYIKEGVSWFLRIFIDRDEGITIEDCEKFSRAIDPLIEEKNILNDFYYLEISSPGIGRELTRDEHLEFAAGQEVLVKLIRPEEGVREITGRLKAFDAETLVLETDGPEKKILRNTISKVKLNDDTF